MNFDLSISRACLSLCACSFIAFTVEMTIKVKSETFSRDILYPLFSHYWDGTFWPQNYPWVSVWFSLFISGGSGGKKMVMHSLSPCPCQRWMPKVSHLSPWKSHLETARPSHCFICFVVLFWIHKLCLKCTPCRW